MQVPSFIPTWLSTTGTNVHVYTTTKYRLSLQRGLQVEYISLFAWILTT